MTHFEPEVPSILEIYDEKHHVLQSFSDNDLLLELRRRKRLARTQAEWVVEGWRIDRGAAPPAHYVIESLLRGTTHEIAARLSSGQEKLPGMKIERGRFDMPGRPRIDISSTPDVRYYIPFNFVVEKP
jgi:hypothetical protein